MSIFFDLRLSVFRLTLSTLFRLIVFKSSETLVVCAAFVMGAADISPSVLNNAKAMRKLLFIEILLVSMHVIGENILIMVLLK